MVGYSRVEEARAANAFLSDAIRGLQDNGLPLPIQNIEDGNDLAILRRIPTFTTRTAVPFGPESYYLWYTAYVGFGGAREGSTG